MEKINVAELLKNCPKGMELDCVMYDGLEFDRVDERSSPNYSIVCRVKTESGQHNLHTFTKYGSYTRESYSKCVIFPKGKATWEGFQRPFKDGDVIVSDKGDIHLLRTLDSSYCAFRVNWGDKLDRFITTGVHVVRFATEEEKQKLFKAIKDNGYRWNAETKTLEKLIEPKFKVGDRVKHISAHTPGIVVKVDDEGYYIDYPKGNGVCYISFTLEKDYELLPNKFDITALKPFESRVLVRTYNRKWVAAFYSHYDKGARSHYCVVGGLWYEQCIPYNDETKHLLDTTDDCCDYYKTWE